MEVRVTGHDKMYRDLYVEQDGKDCFMEDNWKVQLQLTEAQIKTVEALGVGAFKIVVADDGTASVVVE